MRFYHKWQTGFWISFKTEITAVYFWHLFTLVFGRAAVQLCISQKSQPISRSSPQNTSCTHTKKMPPRCSFEPASNKRISCPISRGDCGFMWRPHNIFNPKIGVHDLKIWIFFFRLRQSGQISVWSKKKQKNSPLPTHTSTQNLLLISPAGKSSQAVPSGENPQSKKHPMYNSRVFC